MSLPTALVQRPGRGWYTYWYDTTAKRTRWAKLAPSQSLARRALATLQARLVAGPTLELPDITIAQAYRDWYASAHLRLPPRGQPRNWASTQRRHFTRWILPRLGTLRLHGLTHSHLQSFYQWLSAQVSRKYANHIAATLSCMLRRARGLYLPPGHQLHIRRQSSPKRIPDTLTRAEVAKLIGSLTGQAHLFVRLWIETGLRPAEISWLQWRDIDLDAGKLYVRAKEGHQVKDAEDRAIDLRADTRSLLLLERTRAGARPEGWFHPCDSAGNRHRDISKHAMRLMRKAGITRGSGNLLRHTFASMMLSSGCSLAELQRYMGHSSILITERSYAAFLPGDRSTIHDADFGTSSCTLTSQALAGHNAPTAQSTTPQPLTRS